MAAEKTHLLTGFLDLIYPPACLVCNAFLGDDARQRNGRRVFVCARCLSDFTPIRSPFCPVCGIPFAPGRGEDHPCEDCLRAPPFFDSLAAPYVYQGNLMEAIHRFKYRGRNSFSESLGPLLAEFAAGCGRVPDGPVVLPVPLHPRRLRQRGFNQSLLLARHAAEVCNGVLDFMSLRRVRYTAPQTGLKKEARRRNVRNAFRITRPGRITGRRVLLVDDVATTGHTLNECARVIKKAGAHRVYCLVLARTAER